MQFKTITLLLATGAVLVSPVLASAQTYYGPQQGQGSYGGYGTQPNQGSYGRYDTQQGQGGYGGYNNGYAQPTYPRSSGDYYSSRQTWGVYPQFRGIEQHIRTEIYSSVRDDMIARDDAQELLGQLRSIQNEELREYRVHHRNLPYDDQQRIQGRLNQLDQLVDQTRDEP